MKIEIVTDSAEEAAYLSEMVHLTKDQRRLIRLALSEYFNKMCKHNMETGDNEYSTKTLIELITLHEYENIMHKFGMKFEDRPENPTYFSIAPEPGETPEEFGKRINTRSWLEFDEDDDDEEMPEML